MLRGRRDRGGGGESKVAALAGRFLGTSWLRCRLLMLANFLMVGTLAKFVI